MPRITLAMIIIVAIVYVIGARYPQLAQKVNLA
jgi:hypothetical protein